MPSLSWLTRPLGLHKAKEREAALRGENEWLREELVRTQAELGFSQAPAKRLEGTLEETRSIAKIREDEVKRLSQISQMEQAAIAGTREELVKMERFAARISAVYEEELHGKIPVVQLSVSEFDPKEHDEPRLSSTLADPIIGLPYVSVIIDGDTPSYMFPKHLWSQGEAGGRMAAQLVESDARRYIQSQPGIPQNYELNIQIVLNLKGTIGATSHQYGACLEAFSKSSPLFDVINAGRGKERADGKIRGRLRLDVRNRDCYAVIFGGMHDSGYIPFLEPLVNNGITRAKLRLLLAYQCFMEYQAFDLKWTQFPLVFPQCPYAYISKDQKLVQTGKPPPIITGSPEHQQAMMAQVIATGQGRPKKGKKSKKGK